MRAVFDTNVLLSAVVRPHTPPGQLVQLALHGSFSLASTPHLWSEFERVLGYERVCDLIARCSGDSLVARLVEHVRVATSFVDDCEPRDRWVASDPDDDWVIQCALTASADYIVSGDRHLLALGRVQQIRIASPAEFLSLLGEKT